MIMRTLRIVLLGLYAALLTMVARAGDTNRWSNEWLKGEWPIAAHNFRALEYYFDAATRKITVVFMDLNSSIVYSGIKVMPTGSDLKFSVLSKLGGAGKDTDPMFKDAKDLKWMVSFEAPGFDPKTGKLIYQGETPTDTREIPYKGIRSEPPAQRADQLSQTLEAMIKEDSNLRSLSAIQFLDILKRKTYLTYTFVNPLKGWIKKKDIAEVIKLVNSKEECSSVMLVQSSHLDKEYSTIGREAKYLLLGYKSGIYPPLLNSTQIELDGDALANLIEWCRKN